LIKLLGDERQDAFADIAVKAGYLADARGTQISIFQTGSQKNRVYFAIGENAVRLG
jgi:hypothetical protein